MKKWKDIGEKIIKGILYPVKDNPSLFVFTILGNASVLILGNLKADYTDPFLATLLPFVDGYIYCAIASLLSLIYLRFIIGVVYTGIILGEVFSIFCYHSQYSIRVLQLVMQTNTQESREFIAHTLHTPAPWLAIGLVAICWGLAWTIHQGYQRYGKEKTYRMTGYVLAALILWSAIREVPQYIRIGRCYTEDSTALLGDHKHLPRLSGSTTRLLYSVAFNYVSAKEICQLTQAVRNTQTDGCTFTCPTIVLIIGESYSKYHTNLYVPTYRNVNPQLAALRDSGFLYVHQQAVSCSNLTSVVMREMFSTEHSLFPRVFRQAGYKVCFISNQFTLSFEDLWTRVGGTIFNQPELSQLLFDYRNPCIHCYDEDLLNDLPQTDSLTTQPCLIIFHMMGQHVDYEKRYPDKARHFLPEDIHPRFGGRREQQITAAYDNATRYNDSVVAALWQRFEGTDAVGIYLSDHGEEVYDWRNFYERSDMDHLDELSRAFQLDIPMYFLVTQDFKEQHPDLLKAIESSLFRPWTNTHLSHTLFHLAGISYKDYRSDLDLLSEEYNNNNR